MRLAAATLDSVPREVARFAYDRVEQATGIVHFGIGAFHRAHQAWYTDRAMDGGDRNWMIAGVSLRSAGVAAQMNPQDGLYSLTERSAAGAASRIVGAVSKVLMAREEAEAVIAALARPECRIVSFTVTEKGYCRAADGSLDAELAGADSFYFFLKEGLRRRRDAGLPGLTLLSCDNIAENGRQIARLMFEFLDRSDPALRRWFESECSCPSTMVDRIVPATSAADLDWVEAELGLRDEAAVLTEPFVQWVIEDRFAGPRPSWEQVGVELVKDVAAYETAKLRLLNGAHSALAYLGLEREHCYVHEAILDPRIRPLVERLMRHEAASSLIAAPGQDIPAYIDSHLLRFANPSLQHRLAQIAMDGSQKIPQRWLAVLAHHQSAGRTCPAILTAVAAWLRHVRGDNGPVDDPLATELLAAWRREGSAGIAEALFGSHGLIASAWNPDHASRMLLADCL